jgi:agmatine/peptidylarginine deiminase
LRNDQAETSAILKQFLAITYYLGNSVVVPEFDDPNDRPAQRLLARLFPQHRVIGIHNTREMLLSIPILPGFFCQIGDELLNNSD